MYTIILTDTFKEWLDELDELLDCCKGSVIN